MKILNCEDSYIYIDAPVNTIFISNCANSHIFISAVNKICSIEKCENICVTVAANFIRIGNTVDSTLNYYGSYYPILCGDSRNITLAPNNANYYKFFDRIKSAHIPLMYKNSQNFTKPVIMN